MLGKQSKIYICLTYSNPKGIQAKIKFGIHLKIHNALETYPPKQKISSKKLNFQDTSVFPHVTHKNLRMTNSYPRNSSKKHPKWKTWRAIQQGCWEITGLPHKFKSAELQVLFYASLFVVFHSHRVSREPQKKIWKMMFTHITFLPLFFWVVKRKYKDVHVVKWTNTNIYTFGCDVFALGVLYHGLE